MDMTFNEYTSKMFSILETAIYNYEINTLVEAADGEATDAEVAAKKESRWGAVKALAKKVLSAVWNAIVLAYKKIVEKANELVNAPVILQKDMVVYPGATKFDSTLMRYANEFAAGKIDNVDEAIAYMDKLNMTDKFAKGSQVNTRGIASTAKKYTVAISKLEGISFAGKDKDTLDRAVAACKRIVGVLNSYSKQANELLTAKAEQTEAAAKAKAEAKAAKQKEKMGAMPESVEADDIALSARLILEAANLLREDAEDYVDGIEGGEGTQKAIDDIPEEKPVTTGEYPADDITGGEGEKIDQDEIKELLDNDDEAIAILNDDEGGKAITESVVIHF